MKLIPSLILASFLLLHGTDATAQTFQWLSRIGGPSYDPTPLRPDELVNDMVADELGNVYVCGRIRNNSNINGTPVSTYGGNDIFVAKFDCSGSLVWVRTAGNSDDGDNGLALALDGLGNLYVTGVIYGRYNNGGPFDSPIHFFDTVYNLNTQSMFIAKLDTAGNFLWGKISTFSSEGQRMEVDSRGKIHVLVSCYSAGPGILFPGVPVESGTYILRFDPDGIVEKTLKISSRRASLGSMFSDFKLSPEDEFYLTGHFRGDTGSDTLTIGGITLLPPPASNYSNWFCIKLDSSGQGLWHIYDQNAPNIIELDVYGCALDGHGNVFITGSAYNGMVLGSDTLLNLLTPTGAMDFPFIAKISPQGQVIWARNLHIKYIGRSTGGIAVKSNGDVAVSGFFSGPVKMGTDSFAGSGTNNVFIAEISYDGSNIRGAQVPTVIGGGKTEPRRTVSDAADNILFGGGYAGSMIVNGDTMQIAGGYTDAFVMKWGSASCMVSTGKGPDRRGGEVLVYPNPASTYVNFRFEAAVSTPSRLSIFDVTGREVASAEISRQTMDQRVSLPRLSTGLYYYRIEGDSLYYSGKFLVTGR